MIHPKIHQKSSYLESAFWRKNLNETETDFNNAAENKKDEPPPQN